MERLDFDPKKLHKVSIDTIQPNGWNPKHKDTDEYKNVVKSIQENGLMSPIVVREVGTDSFEIVDGEQRYTASKEAGLTDVYIYNEGKLSDEKAQALTIWYQQQVPFDQLKLADLAIHLDSLDINLPFTDKELEHFRAMSEFSFDDYSQERPEEDEDGVKTLMIKMQADKYDVVMSAINKVREENDCDDARAIELICADYISGT